VPACLPDCLGLRERESAPQEPAVQANQPPLGRASGKRGPDAQVLWALCVYVEAVSVLPQLRMMQNAKARPRPRPPGPAGTLQGCCGSAHITQTSVSSDSEAGAAP